MPRLLPHYRQWPQALGAQEVKPCIRCGKLLRSGSNCPGHNPKNAYRDPAGIKLRAELLATHRRYQGAWCPGAPEMNHLPHETNDLTVDHVNGDNTDNRLVNLRILCRAMNTRRAHTSKPIRVNQRK